MASHSDYLQYVLDQLSLLDGVSFRPMMGEFVLYCRGKVFGGVYDDRFLVKITPSSSRLLSEAEREFPYPGGSEMLMVPDPDDRGFLAVLVEAMLPELPGPKPKRAGKKPGSGV